MTETEFKGAIRLATSRAWIGPGVENFSRIVGSLRAVPGDIVECGSYRGGSAIALAAAAEFYQPSWKLAKNVYSFDTFEGMPEPSEFDMHKKGDFKDVNYEEVRKTAQPYKNLRLVKGEFRLTVPVFRHRPLSLLVLDCDLYASHKLCLEAFWPWLSSQGLLIAEDYQFPGCPGATKAIEEFFGKPLEEKFEGYWGIRKT